MTDERNATKCLKVWTVSARSERRADSDEDVLMMDWKDKGCSGCRGLWESGQRPPELAVRDDLHSRLHKCSVCGTFWEQQERYADTIDEQQARSLYPVAFGSLK